MEEIEITQITRDGRQSARDVVAREVPFTLNANGEELVTLLSSPGDLKELSIGFLFSSGLIRSIDDVESVAVDEQKWRADVALKNNDLLSSLAFKRMYTSGCGRGTIFYNALDAMNRGKCDSTLRVPHERVLELMSEFNSFSTRFKETGCVHSAALSDGEKILFCRDDIGRHNAVDKIIGAMMIDRLDAQNKILLSSGRLSSEIVFKVHHAGLPIIVSRSAPTNQGVRHAREMNLTLVGFVRGRRMNLYSAEERIV